MLKKALENLQIASLNEMQNAALAAAKKGDVVLLSPTGSGKTLGFLLPLLEILKPEATNVQALILVPSRELALQIEQVFKTMATGFKINCCYGGHPVKIERNNLIQELIETSDKSYKEIAAITNVTLGIVKSVAQSRKVQRLSSNGVGNSISEAPNS